MAGESATGLQFGLYELDVRAGKLLRDGVPVKIQPQPLRVLSVLLERPGEIVSREDLRIRIWGDATFVEFDQGLNYCIRQIRLALREEASAPVYIETLPKQGYRFIAPVAGRAVEIPAAVIPPPAAPSSNKGILAGMFLLLLAFGAAILYSVGSRQPPAPVSYTQLTSFTDSAIGPVLSPDGKMVAFFRSDSRFLTSGEIYVKMLPDGEPVQISHDPRRKYNLAFTPNGSRIAYSVLENGFNTYTVPVLGGDSQLLQMNAAGLIWLDPHRLLYSEIRGTGIHMGIVSANEDRSDHREIYFPAQERGMAHYTSPSPDHKWGLVAEMDPEWKSCRLIPLSGSETGREVGPRGACTAAAWSPDGLWMFFEAEVDGRRHLWKQRFPGGQPEQITSGSTDEDGLAMAPDGRSLITSIVTRQNAVWIHDGRGDRPLSNEGYANNAPPRFSSDGKRVYYLLKHDSPESPSELWRSDVETGRSEPVIPGQIMREFDISSDEKEVVFSVRPAGGSSQLWLTPLDRSQRPRMIASTGEAVPHFGADGIVLFRMTEGNKYYLARMNRDGSGRAKVLATPILDIWGVSPDGRYVLLGLPLERSQTPGEAASYAVPITGGDPIHICDGDCGGAWSLDRKLFFVAVSSSGKTLGIPVPAGEFLPRLPVSGIVTSEQEVGIPGTTLIDEAPMTAGLGSTYAYVKRTSHANLFRIPLTK